MLKRRGATHAVSDAEMRKHFEAHLRKVRDWLGKQANITVFYCDYNRLLAEPDAVLPDLAAFLGGNVPVAALRQAIDPALHRQRK